MGPRAEDNRDPWQRGDCDEGMPPGYAERETARQTVNNPKEPTRP